MSLDRLILHPRNRSEVERLLNNLPHALVIEGENGLGVSVLAHAIAESLGSPRLEILPKKKEGSEFVVDMENGNVIIDDIRLLYASTRTTQAGKNIYVIDTGLKGITPQAQNAFLKLLEEPRTDVHFIIATHRKDQLLPTITSRCQMLSLLPVTDEQTKDILDSLNIDDATKRARLAFVGRGKPALLKRLADDSELYKARVQIMTDAKTMLGTDDLAKLVIAQKYRDSRANSLTLLEDMCYQLNTLMKSQPSKQLAKQIEKCLKSHEKIAAQGNIRLQLADCVL